MFAFLEEHFLKKAYESFACVGDTYIWSRVTPNILKEQKGLIGQNFNDFVPGKVWTVKDSWKHWALQREWKPSVRNTFHRLYSIQLLIKWFCITTFKSRASITGSKLKVHIWPSLSEMVVFHLLTVRKRDMRVILCRWRYFLYLKVAAVMDFSLQQVTVYRGRECWCWYSGVSCVPSAIGMGVIRSWSPPEPPESRVAVNHSLLPGSASGFSAEYLTHQLPRERSKSRSNVWEFLVAFARLQFWLHFFPCHQPECHPAL